MLITRRDLRRGPVAAMQIFGELLTTYMKRTGISDSELARSIGVQRQTIFRWKEGATGRPRVREDVLRCAARLRLTPEERDLLLLAAGFPPEALPTSLPHVPEAGPAEAETPARLAVPAAMTEQAAEPAVEASPGVKIPDMPASPTVRPAQARTVGRTPAFLLAVAVTLLALAGAAAGAVWWLADRAAPPPTPAPATPAVAAVCPQAADGATLLLVAPFANYTVDQGYNVAGRIRDALRAEVARAGLNGAVVELCPAPLTSESQAAAALARAGAALLVWGEFDSGRVRAQVLAADAAEPAVWERQLGSPADLPLTVNAEAPREVAVLAKSALGALFQAESDFGKAQAVLGEAIEQPPLDPASQAKLYFFYALAHEKLTPPDWMAAIEAYSQTLSLKPEWTNALYNRGTAYLKHSRTLALDDPNMIADLDRAIVDLSGVIAERPSYWEAYLNRGSSYFERKAPGDLAAALGDYSMAVSLAPDVATPYFARALAAIRAGDEEAWRRDLAKALELAPNSPDVLMGHCWAYAAAFQPEEALPWCERALARSPTPDASRDIVGLVHAEAGRLAEAQTEFERYLAWVETQPRRLYERLNGARVAAWLADLKAGMNPATPAAVDQFRRES